MKKKFKVIIVLAVVAGIGFATISAIAKNAAAAAMAQSPRTITMQKGDLSYVVSVTGTVFSKTSTNVYSDVAAKVKTVHVEVGDRVQEGDLLAELDTADLEQSLAKSQASLLSQQATAQHALDMAKKDLENYKNNNKAEANTSVLMAESSLKSAEIAVDNAVSEVYRARKTMIDAREAWTGVRENNPNNFDDDDYGGGDLGDTYYASYKSAKNTYDRAQESLTQANASYEARQKDYEAAKVANIQGLEAREDGVKSAELANKFDVQHLDIKKLQEDIGKCNITAPVSGTITSVSAIEGAAVSGLVFVIQDTNELKIITNIKEYDVEMVTVGDAVTIKSDATGDKIYEGILSRIAPTSTVAAMGDQAVSNDKRVNSDSEYESYVTVVGEKEGLRIGMNTKLSIITDERKNVFSVPYEAVGQNDDGEFVIYVMETEGAGTVAVRELKVTIGMENDLFSEIQSSELIEGMVVYRDAAEGMAAYATNMVAGTDSGKASSV